VNPATMPNAAKTPTHSVRIGEDDWDDLGEVAESIGSDRSWIIRRMVAWYLRRPGASLPERPPGR
jgi:Ribbon-helix-helix protein, copG family